MGRPPIRPGAAGKTRMIDQIGKWTLVTLPLGLLLAVAVAVVVRRALAARRAPRDGFAALPGKSLYGRVLLWLFFAGLFGLDFFLFLRRDGFRASWSVTFWLMLAAFMIGEMIGRWGSYRADDQGPPPEG